MKFANYVHSTLCAFPSEIDCSYILRRVSDFIFSCCTTEVLSWFWLKLSAVYQWYKYSRNDVECGQSDDFKLCDHLSSAIWKSSMGEDRVEKMIMQQICSDDTHSEVKRWGTFARYYMYSIFVFEYSIPTFMPKYTWKVFWTNFSLRFCLLSVRHSRGSSVNFRVRPRCLAHSKENIL